MGIEKYDERTTGVSKRNIEFESYEIQGPKKAVVKDLNSKVRDYLAKKYSIVSYKKIPDVKLGKFADVNIKSAFSPKRNQIVISDNLDDYNFAEQIVKNTLFYLCNNEGVGFIREQFIDGQLFVFNAVLTDAVVNKITRKFMFHYFLEEAVRNREMYYQPKFFPALVCECLQISYGRDLVYDLFSNSESEIRNFVNSARLNKHYEEEPFAMLSVELENLIYMKDLRKTSLLFFESLFFNLSDQEKFSNIKRRLNRIDELYTSYIKENE